MGQIITLDYCPYHQAHGQPPWTKFCGADQKAIKDGRVIPMEHIDKVRGRIWKRCPADGQVGGVAAKESWIEEMR